MARRRSFLEALILAAVPLALVGSFFPAHQTPPLTSASIQGGGLLISPTQAFGLKEAVFEIEAVDERPIEVLGCEHPALYRLPSLTGRPRWGLRVVGTSTDIGSQPVVVRQGENRVDATIEWSFLPMTTDGRSPFFLFTGAPGSSVSATLDLVVPEAAKARASIAPTGKDGEREARSWHCELATEPNSPQLLRVTVRGVVERLGDTRLQLVLDHGLRSASVPIIAVGLQ